MMKLRRMVGAGVFALLASGVVRANPTEAGKLGFEAKCAVCHHASGRGIADLAPPLLIEPARLAASEPGRRQLGLTLLRGMYGPARVGGKRYSLKMPSFAALGDDELAAVLNYVVFALSRNSLPSGLQPFSGKEIQALRDKPITPDALNAQREAFSRAPEK